MSLSPRQLRAGATDAERRLWSKLRSRSLVGAKFRRQVPFPPYTVDFCCFEAKLIVEVDGSQHADSKRDAVRTRRLERDGFTVIRFWNNDVLTNTDGVLEAIMSRLNVREASFAPEPVRPSRHRSTGAGSRKRVMAARSHVSSRLASVPVPSHLYKVRVYFEDTDAGGMVYYANYLKFAERARTEMLRSAGINHAEMVARDGLMFVVRRCSAEFHRSARLDDELEVETRVMDVAGASLTLAQAIRRGGESLVDLSVTVACINREGRATRLPERVRALVSAGIAIN